MNGKTSSDQDFTVAYYSGDRKTGSISTVTRKAGNTTVTAIKNAQGTGLDKALKPIFIGLTEDKQVILLDPKSKEITFQDDFPIDAFPAHIYSDPNSSRDLFMNDGDKETGNDTINCGDQGSSISVVENISSSSAKYLGTTCVGRGHHQATFSYPSPQAAKVPNTIYISNLKDGTLSAIGNDPADAETYLKVIATVNLCEPDKDDAEVGAVPNNAFPHGLVYSQVSGKVYNLNNGYGTIAVIDPLTNTIEKLIPFKGHSNLMISPDGRYIIGRGADRKSDADHVVAKLSVLDTATNEIVDKADLVDIYISKYYFNLEATRLYLTTGSSGSDEQKANIKSDALLVFDLTALPKLKLINEVRLGCPSGSLDFLLVEGADSLAFSSNSSQGELVVLNGNTGEVMERIAVNDGVSHSRAWVL